ncbi:MAG: hypothetical protein HY593_00540 [Candidatus Omnitrophica bacterium]|nr:hypothetical protein [Candidatus Omnitrophota bacterium]
MSGSLTWAGPAGGHLANMPTKIRHIGEGFVRRHPPQVDGCGVRMKVDSA